MRHRVRSNERERERERSIDPWKLVGPYYVREAQTKGGGKSHPTRVKEEDAESLTTERYMPSHVTEPIQQTLETKGSGHVNNGMVSMGKHPRPITESNHCTPESGGVLRLKAPEVCQRRPPSTTAEIRAYYDRG